MFAARLHAFGKAAEILRVEEIPTPDPQPGELLIAVLVAAVNPADLNVIEGKYGELPALPAVIGNEGVGRVAAIGSGVAGFTVGDLVLPMRPGTWTQYMLAPARAAIRLPAAMDLSQAAMLSVNPPSAWGMLQDFVELQPGDWIVQNAANSAVGRSVIQIAHARGLRTLNVVRRQELIGELQTLGADAVVLEDVDLRTEVEKICGLARPRLALNAVGGASALNLANALADGGTHVTYGAMGRQPLKIPNSLLIFRNLVFRGFWLKPWAENVPRAEQEKVIAALAALSLAGKLTMPVHRTYPLTEVHQAVEEATRESRAGKVLLELSC